MGAIAIPVISAVSGMSAVQSAFWLAANKGALLAGAGTAVSTAGVIQQGRVAVAQAKSAQNVEDYNALVQEREAEAIRQKTSFELQRHAESAARARSAMIAELGETEGLGSPVVSILTAEQAAEQELANLLIGYEGEILAGKALKQAELDKLQGRIYRERGKTQRAASLFRAGGTLLTGFGAAYA